MYIVERILDKCESSSVDWRRGSTGNRTYKIHQSDYNKCGKSKLLKEAEELEKKNLIEIKWLTRGSDIFEIKYKLSDLESLYDLSEGRIPKWKIMESLKKEIEDHVCNIKTQWIRDYYNDVIKRFEPGNKLKIPENEQEYFCAFEGLDKLTEPVYKRLFSRKYMKNSKAFERDVQSHVISVAKKYCPMVNSEMSDTEVLSQLYIEEYSQEMSVKGPLIIETFMDGEEIIHDLKSYKYGTVLNTETMKNSHISKIQPDLKRIIMIENKANFVIAPYKEDTLYIYTHGYFSPTEIKFLKQLYNVENYDNIEIYHSSDLDYGGIKIFEFIEKNLFDKVMPYMMDEEVYEKYIDYGEEIEKVTLDKIEKSDVPKLRALIDKILEHKKGIEQESFLVDYME